jgi:hypothetical protein
MRKSLIGLLTAAALCLTIVGVRAEEHSSSAKAEAPDATISLTGTSVAAGVGVTWGEGILTFKGKSYPVSVSGLTVASAGASKGSAVGKVYNLKSVDDFAGTYAALGAGATVGGGEGVATMKNQKGVKIDLTSSTQGLKFTIGASGVNMKLKG